MAPTRPSSAQAQIHGHHKPHCTTKAAASKGSRVKRWDGRKGVNISWRHIGKNSELWTPNGNCVVYLEDNIDGDEKQWQTRRVPAFKVSLTLLLAAKCYPLIERFFVLPAIKNDTRPRGIRGIQKWYRSDPTTVVELSIPMTNWTDKRKARLHRMSTRNFFAWLLKRPLVGETFGQALIGLVHSMREYRTGIGKVNIERDVSNYLASQDYMNFAGQPDLALGVLLMAETFHMKELYLRALTHCVGMCDLLLNKVDYLDLSLKSRSLIREAQAELHVRLESTSAMLYNFLDHELSKSHIGIPADIRTHLERFRSFILSFYSMKLGYYPPRKFDGSVYRTMTQDFQALYDLLVDEGYSLSENMPATAAGGICTLQLIESFDSNNFFEAIRHPLPRLPDENLLPRSNKCISWLLRGSKKRVVNGHMSHIALVSASNWKDGVFENDLVRAYRAFEESCALSPRKADRDDKVSLVDGRKVRWILIYAVYQTLRHATQRPLGVPDDANAPYVVSLAKNTLPPWQVRNHSGSSIRSAAAMSEIDTMNCPLVDSGNGDKFEIKPDIDYFALKHKEATRHSKPRRASTPASVHNQPSLLRSSSIKRALKRNSTIRRSVRRLRQSSPTSVLQNHAVSKPLYHEILVHGYGNGTNHVHTQSGSPSSAETPPRPELLASRRATTESDAGSSAVSSTISSASTADTMASSQSSISSSSRWEMPTPKPGKPYRWSHQDHMNTARANIRPAETSKPAPAVKNGPLRLRPISCALEGYSYAARALSQFVDNDRRGLFATSRPAGDAVDLKHNEPLIQGGAMPDPTREDEISQQPYVSPRDSGDWTAMQAFLDGTVQDEGGGSCRKHAWEQYTDLGGLTEVI